MGGELLWFVRVCVQDKFLLVGRSVVSFARLVPSSICSPVHHGDSWFLIMFLHICVEDSAYYLISPCDQLNWRIKMIFLACPCIVGFLLVVNECIISIIRTILSRFIWRWIRLTYFQCLHFVRQCNNVCSSAHSTRQPQSVFSLTMLFQDDKGVLFCDIKRTCFWILRLYRAFLFAIARKNFGARGFKKLPIPLSGTDLKHSNLLSNRIHK
jgi:hypothetical protein